MGGFLQNNMKDIDKIVYGFRPLSRYEWFPTKHIDKDTGKELAPFPAPRDAWVVSYKI